MLHLFLFAAGRGYHADVEEAAYHASRAAELARFQDIAGPVIFAVVVLFLVIASFLWYSFRSE